jgi:transcriptional regulator with XRE-family HTH domain
VNKDEPVHPVDRLVGQRVRLLRLSRGLSQTQLATALGLSFQQVQKYESATNRISASRLFEIAKVFEVEIGDLFADAAGLKVKSGRRKPAVPSVVDLDTASKLSEVKDDRVKRKVLELVAAISKTTKNDRYA